MARTKGGARAHARHKKVTKMTKGFRGRAKNCYKIARIRLDKALQYSYRDRRNKKRDFRKLWIQRINAGVRQHGLSYSQFIHGLTLANIQLDRKILADMAMNDAAAFEVIVKAAQKELGKKAA